MKVAVGAVPDLAAEQLIERHLRPLRLDVPQRNIDAAHRVEQDRSIAPVRTDVARLPDVLDRVDVSANEKWLEVLFDRGVDDTRALRECRAAPADQAGLGGFHLHNDETDVVG